MIDRTRYTIAIINPHSGQQYTSMSEGTLEELQLRFTAWKHRAKRNIRVSGMIAVITKEVVKDRKWVEVNRREDVIS